MECNHWWQASRYSKGSKWFYESKCRTWSNKTRFNLYSTRFLCRFTDFFWGYFSYFVLISFFDFIILKTEKNNTSRFLYLRKQKTLISQGFLHVLTPPTGLNLWHMINSHALYRLELWPEKIVRNRDFEPVLPPVKRRCLTPLTNAPFILQYNI